MAELFKDLYGKQFFELFTDGLNEVIVDFNRTKFLAEIYESEWKDMEFKQRMHHIADVLKNYLSNDFPESTNQLYEIIAALKANGSDKAIKYAELAFVFIPDYIEQNGIAYFEASVIAFEKITPFTSCEFAVRPFIIKYEGKMLEKVMQWTAHKNEHVRRLASEGSRSRLPWGMAIQSLKKNPKPVLPILEALKNDPSEYVRKSVANNLNDISKDNPQTVISLAKQWKGKTKETDWVVKHACRTLLKEGNTEVMQLFGFASPDEIEVKNLCLDNDNINIGDYLEFNFQLQNHSKNDVKIRLEYAIYYRKRNGTRSKKVYKISEKNYAPKSQTIINRRQSFKLISTRKFHAGQHILSIIINGVEVDDISFELLS